MCVKVIASQRWDVFETRCTYLDAVCCYQPSSVVCWSFTVVSPAKIAEPIEMPLGSRTRVGPGNHVLDGGPDPPCEGAILKGEGASHCEANSFELVSK